MLRADKETKLNLMNTLFYFCVVVRQSLLRVRIKVCFYGLMNSSKYQSANSHFEDLL